MKLTEIILEAVDPESPQFKQWFKSSKVVNEAGQPKIVYHGTNSPHEFVELKGGTHFGTQNASHVFSKGSGGRIYPVYLRIENPLWIEDFESAIGVASDYLIGAKDSEDVPNNVKKAVIQLLKKWKREQGRETLNISRLPTNAFDQVRNLYQSFGYDGLAYVNGWEDKTSVSWIPFTSDQIKYAYASNI